MGEVALNVEQLTVEVEGRGILHSVNLAMKLGESHVLFGPNGSGRLRPAKKDLCE
jgi:Fe-S cluster assembly ATP-binding protein